MVEFVCTKCGTKFKGDCYRNPDFTSATPNECCKKNSILLPITGKDILPNFDRMFYITPFNDVTIDNFGNKYISLGYFPDNLAAQKYLNYILRGNNK